MQTRKSTTKKPFKAVVGAAHHALRAYAKAYDEKDRATAPHQYFIPEDGLSASILNARGQEVEKRSIQEWAALGPDVRRAIIALRFFQERYRELASIPGHPAKVRFYLNILEGRAGLVANGCALSTGDLCDVAPQLKLGDTTVHALRTLGPADTLSAWATLGKQVEVDFFQTLQAAERYRLKEAAAEQRERGYRLGIIRKPKDRRAPSERTGWTNRESRD